MNRKAVKSAKHALSRARAALEEFETAENLTQQRTAWWDFLLASAAVYEKLKAGAKAAGGKTYGWWSSVVKERKNDELLSYIHHARNSAYHEIDEVTEGIGSVMQIGPSLIGGKIDEDASFVEQESVPSGVTETHYINGIQVTAEQAKTMGVFSRHRSYLKLIPVIDERFGVTYVPPSLHLGAPIKGEDPLTVGKAAIAHHMAVVIDCLRYTT